MVRNYKRKTADRWSKEDLLEALVGIKEGNLRVDEAAEIYKISRATLYRQYKNFVIGGSKRDVNQFRTTGPNTILGSAEEEVLEQTIKNLREQGHAVSGNDIKRICFEYCDANGIPNKFNQEKRMASDDWYYGFLNRHPGVKISRPTKQNGSGEASGSTSAPENPNTLSASDKPGDVYALKDGTLVFNTAPTKGSRTSDEPNQAPSLKSSLKSKKRPAGTGEETPPGNDCKRAKKDSDQSSVLEGVDNGVDENANMGQELQELDGEDGQKAEGTDKEDEEEDEDDEGVEMDKEQLEDAANGGESDSSDEEESDTSESGEENSDTESGEEKDGIGGAEESDNDSEDDNETTESSSPHFSDIESD